MHRILYSFALLSLSAALGCVTTGTETDWQAVEPGGVGEASPALPPGLVLDDDPGAQAPIQDPGAVGVGELLITLPPDCPVDPASYFGFDPWELGVVVIDQMGLPDEPYCSDFQGAAAVGGNVYAYAFSLNDLGGPTDVSLYAGGEVVFTGAVNNGGLEVEGDILLAGASVAGDVVGGGDLDGSGTISGDVTLTGVDHAGYPLTISGTLAEGVAFAPTVDLVVLTTYFETVSSIIGNKAATVTAGETYGEITVDVVSGANYVDLGAQELDDAWGVRIEGPADASLYINVADSTATLDSLVWTYAGGITASRVLLNYHGATDLDLSGGDHQVSIMAPGALVTYSAGLVSGNLIAGDLQGCGQVNLGPFEPNPWEDAKKN